MVQWLKETHQQSGHSEGKHLERVRLIYKEFYEHFQHDAPVHDERSRDAVEVVESKIRELQQTLKKAQEDHTRQRSQADKAATFQQNRIQSDASKKVTKANAEKVEAQAELTRIKTLLAKVETTRKAQAQSELSRIKSQLVEAQTTIAEGLMDLEEFKKENEQLRKENDACFKLCFDYEIRCRQANERITYFEEAMKKCEEMAEADRKTIRNVEELTDVYSSLYFEAKGALGSIECRDEQLGPWLRRMVGFQAITTFLLFGTAAYLRSPAGCALTGGISLGVGLAAFRMEKLHVFSIGP